MHKNSHTPSVYLNTPIPVQNSPEQQTDQIKAPGLFININYLLFSLLN